MLDIDLVQTSCGLAVPLMDFQADREQLNEFHASLTQAQLQK